MYEEWPTIQEASQATGISTRTLERHISKKLIQREFRPQEGKKPVVILNPEDLQKLVEKKEDGKIKPLPKAKAPATPTSRHPAETALVAGFMAALWARPQISLDKKVYLNEREAAIFLGLPKAYVERQRITLQGKKVSGRWFYQREHLNRHVLLS